MPYENLTPEESKELLHVDEECVLIDVRSTPEFDEAHVTGSHHVPLAEYNPSTGMMEPNPDFVKVIDAAYGKDANLVFV